MLYLKIIKLNQLLSNNDMFSKNDIFVSIRYGEQERRTTIKWNNNQPEWGESFVFPINHSDKTISFQLYDADNWSECEIVGEEIVDIHFEQLKEITTEFLVIEIGNIFYDMDQYITKLENAQNQTNKEINELKKENNELDIKLQKIKDIIR